MSTHGNARQIVLRAPFFRYHPGASFGDRREEREMSIRCVVVDFDGTFTDVAVEAVPFEPAFMASLADMLGRDVRDEWARERAVIEKTPEQFG